MHCSRVDSSLAGPPCELLMSSCPTRSQTTLQQKAAVFSMLLYTVCHTSNTKNTEQQLTYTLQTLQSFYIRSDQIWSYITERYNNQQIPLGKGNYFVRDSKSWKPGEAHPHNFFENLRKIWIFKTKTGKTDTFLWFCHSVPKFFKVIRVYMAFKPIPLRKIVRQNFACAKKGLYFVLKGKVVYREHLKRGSGTIFNI